MKLPFDRSHRRRIYLMRHADAQYIQPDGTRAPDSRVVPLTARGIDEAGDMSRLLKDVAFDRVICSGLPRTQQTARIVMGDRNLTLEIEPALEEIRGGDPIARANLSPVDYAYAMFCASEPDACFASGEKFSDFYGRIVPAFEGITQATNWTRLLLVAHGGVNRAIVSHALTGQRYFLGNLSQAPGCINALDVGTVREDWVVRLTNYAPSDLLQPNERETTMEVLYA